MSNADSLRQLVGSLVDRAWGDIELKSWPTEYGLDSLSILIFREQCEGVFGMVIPDDDWANMCELSHILHFIESHVPKNGRTHVPVAQPSQIPTEPEVRWGDKYFADRVQIGMPLTGVNNLSENALLKYVGDLRWRHLEKMSGEPSRNFIDGSGHRLYPTFFYVDVFFPENTSMADFGENDCFDAVDYVSRYGHSIVDGVTFLLQENSRNAIAASPTSIEDAKRCGLPAIRMSNIFVMMFDGAQWLKKGRPRDGLIDAIEESAAAPETTLIAKRAETEGYIEYPDDSFVSVTDAPLEFSYEILPDRDVNGAGLLYFANYPVFLDLAERDALRRAKCRWPDEVINKRSTARRKVAYLNNATWKDKLKIETRLWINCTAHNNCVQVFSVQRMWRRSDDRLMCVASTRKLLRGLDATELRTDDKSYQLR